MILSNQNRRELYDSIDDTAAAIVAQADLQAFAPLYERYVQPVYRYCYRRLGTEELAEDATSEVFVKALTNLSQYRGGSFRAWLFTIAHNVVVDMIRRAKPQLPLDTTFNVADSAPTPEAVVLNAHQHNDLLSQLPEEQRRVVELRLVGLTGVEIAQVLEKTPASVKALQFRAMTRLRKYIGCGSSKGSSNE